MFCAYTRAGSRKISGGESILSKYRSYYTYLESHTGANNVDRDQKLCSALFAIHPAIFTVMDVDI